MSYIVPTICAILSCLCTINGCLQEESEDAPLSTVLLITDVTRFTAFNLMTIVLWPQSFGSRHDNPVVFNNNNNNNNNLFY